MDNRLILRRLFLKIRHYEYWPMWAFYLPLIPFFIFNGVIKRNLFFFTNVNKGLEAFGGLFFDSKSSIDQQIPEHLRPKATFLKKGLVWNEIDLPTNFPIIFKPNSGERGQGVIKINDASHWNSLNFKILMEDYLLQEFINWDIEFGVFISYIPNEKKYKIISITEKEYFSVIGNGTLSINELVIKNDRGLVFYDEIKQRSIHNFDSIPKKGEKLTLHQLGNHSKGTKFIDKSSLINQEMEAAFNDLLVNLKNFEYGRFDIKCKNTSDLTSFQNLKIIEFNGIAAEPTHIYDEKIGYFKSLLVFKNHWKYLIDIAKYNKINGIQAYSNREVWKKIWIKCLKKT